MFGCWYVTRGFLFLSPEEAAHLYILKYGRGRYNRTTIKCQRLSGKRRLPSKLAHPSKGCDAKNQHQALDEGFDKRESVTERNGDCWANGHELKCEHLKGGDDGEKLTDQAN